MSCNNDLLASRPRKQPCLLDAPSQRLGPSTWTRHSRICRSTSLPLYRLSSPADLDPLLDPLDEITLDNDLDQCSVSSATLLSHNASSTSPSQLWKDTHCASSDLDLPAHPSESRQLLPLREPGQMTVLRTQRLRARTAAVIMSLPATSEEVVDADEGEPHRAAKVPPIAQMRKLRRVSAVRDLRRAFRDADNGQDHGPVHFASISSLGASKASYELGFLASSTPPSSSHLSSRSSSRTLVDSLNVRPQSSGDLKTLCGSTFSSTSIASRFASKVPSTLSSSRPSHMRSPSDTSQLILAQKHLVHNPLTPRPRRHASLQLDTPPSGPPADGVWSCAKISQSALKRAARRVHNPRRVFSNPIAALAS